MAVWTSKDVIGGTPSKVWGSQSVLSRQALTPTKTTKTTAPTVKGGMSALFNPVTNPVSTPIAKSTPFEPLQKKLSGTPPVKSQYPTEKKATISKTGDDILKFGAKTAIAGASMVAQGLDYTTDLIAKNLVSKEKPQWKPIQVLNDKWLKWYEDKEAQGEIPTQKLQRFVDTLAQSDYVQDRPEWKKLTLGEKFSKEHIAETVLNIAPSVIASIATYAVNPFFGFTVAATSTAQDVKESAISYGVPSSKAEKLGLATGLAIGWLDKLVPSEVFTPATKKLFMAGLLKNIVKITLKETGTEILQEDIQLAVEATFRDDLGWDEIKTRNAMSALGGFLGGTGFSAIGSFANQTVQEDILDQPVIKSGENDPQEVLNKIIGTPAQDTTRGKTLIKEAVIAQQEGRTVVVEPRTPKAPPISPQGVKVPSISSKRSDIIKVKGDNSKSTVLNADNQLSIDVRGLNTAQVDALNSIFIANGEKEISSESTSIIVSGEELKMAVTAHPVLLQNSEIKSALSAVQQKTSNLPTSNLSLQEGNINGQLPSAGNITTNLTKPSDLSGSKIKVVKKVKPKKKVSKKVVVKPKTPSKIARSIEAKAIESKLSRGFEGLAGYEKVSVKNQRIRALRTLQDIEQTRKIIRGEAELPAGLKGISLVTAVEERIAKTGDMELAYELANSPLISEVSAAAQELRLAAERIPDSATLRIQQLKNKIDQRIKNVEEKKSKVKDRLKEEVKKNNLSKEETSIDNFINSIIC
jgi:hypothetical protein